MESGESISMSFETTPLFGNNSEQSSLNIFIKDEPIDIQECTVDELGSTNEPGDFDEHTFSASRNENKVPESITTSTSKMTEKTKTVSTPCVLDKHITTVSSNQRPITRKVIINGQTKTCILVKNPNLQRNILASVKKVRNTASNPPSLNKPSFNEHTLSRMVHCSRCRSKVHIDSFRQHIDACPPRKTHAKQTSAQKSNATAKPDQIRTVRTMYNPSTGEIVILDENRPKSSGHNSESTSGNDSTNFNSSQKVNRNIEKPALHNGTYLRNVVRSEIGHLSTSYQRSPSIYNNLDRQIAKTNIQSEEHSYSISLSSKGVPSGSSFLSSSDPQLNNVVEEMSRVSSSPGQVSTTENSPENFQNNDSINIMTVSKSGVREDSNFNALPTYEAAQNNDAMVASESVVREKHMDSVIANEHLNDSHALLTCTTSESNLFEPITELIGFDRPISEDSVEATIEKLNETVRAQEEKLLKQIQYADPSSITNKPTSENVKVVPMITRSKSVFAETIRPETADASDSSSGRMTTRSIKTIVPQCSPKQIRSRSVPMRYQNAGGITRSKSGAKEFEHREDVYDARENSSGAESKRKPAPRNRSKLVVEKNNDSMHPITYYQNLIKSRSKSVDRSKYLNISNSLGIGGSTTVTQNEGNVSKEVSHDGIFYIPLGSSSSESVVDNYNVNSVDKTYEISQESADALENYLLLADTTFSCSFCSFTTDKKRTLNEHERHHRRSNLPIVQCVYCSQRYTRYMLYLHVQNVHPGQTFQIRGEESENATRTTALPTTSLSTGSKPTSQSSKPKKSASKASVKFPTRKSRAISKSTPITNVSALVNELKPEQYLAHIDTISKADQITHEPSLHCLTCSFSTTDERKLELHTKEHLFQPAKRSDPSGQIIFDCKMCSYACRNVRDMRTHIKSHRKKLPIIQCPHCNFKSTSRALQSHTRKCKNNLKSRNEENIEGISNEVRTNQSSVSLRIQPKSTFKCPKCTFYTFLRIKLKFHMIKRHLKPETSGSRKVYDCKLCSFITFRGVEYSSHMKTHVRRQPIKKCSKCHYKSTPSYLQRHTCDKAQSSRPEDVQSKRTDENIIDIDSFKDVKIEINREKSNSSDEISNSARNNTNAITTSKTPNAEKALSSTPTLLQGNICCKGKSGRSPEVQSKKLEENIIGIDGSKAVKTKTKISSRGASTTKKVYKCNLCSFVTSMCQAYSAHMTTHARNLPIKKCPKCNYESTPLYLQRHTCDKGQSIRPEDVQSKRSDVNIIDLDDSKDVQTDINRKENNSSDEINASSRDNTNTITTSKRPNSDNALSSNPISLEGHCNKGKAGRSSEVQSKKSDENTIGIGSSEGITTKTKISSRGASKIKKMYKCKLCSFITSVYLVYSSHMSGHARNLPIKKCRKCNYKSTPLYLNLHVCYKSKLGGSEQVHFKRSQETIIDTNGSQAVKTDLNQKISNTTDETEISFKDNSKTISSRKTPNSYGNRYMFQCSLCSFSTSLRIILNSHTKKYHRNLNSEPFIKSGDYYICSYCSFVCPRVTQLIQHLGTHTKMKWPIKKCEHCDYKSTRSALAAHARDCKGKQAEENTITLSKSDEIDDTTKLISQNRSSEVKVEPENSTIEDTRDLAQTKSNISSETDGDYCVQDISQVATSSGKELRCTIESKSSSKDPSDEKEPSAKSSSSNVEGNIYNLSSENTDALKSDENICSQAQSMNQETSSKMMYKCTARKRDMSPHIKQEVKSSPNQSTVHRTQVYTPQYSHCDTESKVSSKSSEHSSETVDQKQSRGPDSNSAIFMHSSKADGCNMCSYTSSSRANIRRHEESHRRGNFPVRKCPNCPYRLTPQLLSVHLLKCQKAKLNSKNTCNTSEVYRCTICSYTTMLKSILKRHMGSHVEHSPNQSTVQEVQLFKPQDNHVTPKSKVSSNSSQSRSETVGARQKQAVGPDSELFKNSSETYGCNRCSYTSSNISHIRRHKESHRRWNWPINQCPYCTYRLTPRALFVHLRKCHKAKVTSKNTCKVSEVCRCTMCSYTTTLKSTLKRHMDSHTEHVVTSSPNQSAGQRTQVFKPQDKHYNNKPELNSKSSESCFERVDVDQKHSTGRNRAIFMHSSEAYRCNICSYTSRKHMRRHKESHRRWNLPVHQCPYCTYRLTPKALSYHLLKCHKGKLTSKNTCKASDLYRCTLCSYTTTLQSTLKRHMGSHIEHEVRSSPNQSTVQTVQIFKSQDNHLSTKSKVGPTNSQSSSETVGAHQKQAVGPDSDLFINSSETYGCKMCSYTSPRKGHVRRHEVSHQLRKAPVRQCPYCTCRLIPRALSIHLRICHNANLTSQNICKVSEVCKCTICSYTTTLKSTLKRHMDSHTEHLVTSSPNPSTVQRMQIFKPQDNHFSTRSKLSSKRSQSRSETIGAHQKQAIGSDSELFINSCETYGCNMCSYTSPRKSHLRRHEVSHQLRKVPVRQCPYCTCRLIPRALSIHLRLCHNAKLTSKNTRKASEVYRCSICSYTTTLKSTLKRHLASHGISNASAKQCSALEEQGPKCPKKTTQKVLLKCLKCSYSTYQTKILRAHEERKHPKGEEIKDLSPERFKCEYCSFNSFWRYLIERHMNSHTLKLPIRQCKRCDFRSTPTALSAHRKSCTNRSRRVSYESENSCSNIKTEFADCGVTESPKTDSRSIELDETQKMLGGRIDSTASKVVNDSDLAKTEDTLSSIEGCAAPDPLNNTSIIHEEQRSPKDISASTSMAGSKDNTTKIAFHCPKCAFSTHLRIKLNIHLKKNHLLSQTDDVVPLASPNKSLRKCEYCSFVATRSRLMRHVCTHTIRNMPINKCSRCDFRSTRFALEQHEMKCFRLAR